MLCKAFYRKAPLGLGAVLLRLQAYTQGVQYNVMWISYLLYKGPQIYITSVKHSNTTVSHRLQLFNTCVLKYCKLQYSGMIFSDSMPQTSHAYTSNTKMVHFSFEKNCSLKLPGYGPGWLGAVLLFEFSDAGWAAMCW